MRLFPVNNIWNVAVDQLPLDPNSDAIMAPAASWNPTDAVLVAFLY
jgi:hypothetical protein